MSKVRKDPGATCAKNWSGRNMGLCGAVQKGQVWPEQEESEEVLMETQHDRALEAPFKNPVFILKTTRAHQRF